MNEPSSTITSGAPDLEAEWLVSVMQALEQLRPYRTDPTGVIKMSRVIAKFQWDGVNHQFYANLTDSQHSFGSVVDSVITGIDPDRQSVNEAAAYVDGQIVQFLNRHRSYDTG